MRVLFDLTKHIHRQKHFSFRTFGPPRPVNPEAGVLDHIAKELKEVERSPRDIEEWVDVIILAIDGALRVGYSPEQIAAAIEIKQRKNELRRWPDWRKSTPGKAIEHVKERE